MSMDDYGGVEVGLVVSIGALRGILRSLHVNGRNWWIGSDPEDAKENGWIRLGWGERHCTDPLNVQYFRAPIVNSAQERTPDKLLVLFDASLIFSEDRRYPRDADDSVGDFEDFFNPLKAALIARLQAGA